MAISNISVGDVETISKLNQAIERINELEGLKGGASSLTAAIQALINAALSGYATDTELASAIQNMATDSEVAVAINAALASYATDAEVSAAVTALQAALTVVITSSDTALSSSNSLLGQAFARPGDARVLFSSALTGSALSRAPITAGIVVPSADLGSVLRIRGVDTDDVAGYVDVARRIDFAIDPGRAYLVSATIDRNADPSDPANNAVEIRWQNLNANKASVSNVRLGDILLPTVAGGPLRVSFLIGKAGAPGTLAYTIPPSAIYGLPLVRVYGNGAETDVASIDVRDVTDDISGGTELAEIINRIAEEEEARQQLAQVVQSLATSVENRLRVDADQNLSSEQKRQAKENLGLDRVDNTPDNEKPVSELTQAAINALVADLSEEGEGRAAADKIHDDKIYAYGSRDVVDLAKKYARSGYDIVTFNTSGRILSALRKRDDTAFLGTRGLEVSGGLHFFDNPKFRRSGIIAATIDKFGRLISGFRQRDQTYLLPARALEVGAATRIDSGAKFARSGVVAAVVDQSGRLIRGQNAVARRERLGADGIETRYQGWDGLNPASLSRSGYVKATVNEDRRVIDAVKTSGSAIVNGLEVAVPSEAWTNYVVYTKMVGGFQHVFSERRETGVRLQLSRPDTENANPRFEPDGSVVWEQLTDSYGRVLWTSAADSVTTRRVFPMVEMLGAGDSLVEANYGAQLAALAGIPYRNIGRSGATSTNVATRLGGRRMRLASVTGFIPASGSVEVDSLDGLGVLSFYGDASVSNVPGSWAGVPGTLSWDKPTRKITFARTMDGAAVVVRGGIPFEPLIIENGTGAALPDLMQRIIVFGFGRNDMENHLRIFANLQAVVAAIPTIAKHWVFVLPMPSKSEVLGNWVGYQSYLALKALCLAAYPNNTFDMLGHFLTKANGSAEDQAAVAAGYAPPSLMSNDEIHPNAMGIAAEAGGLYNFINPKGYF
ncbi:hypothetical protein [Rhizobium sp. NFR03]|uniref:hypothetical protein n=1 Tax=Rhizobium sp. NFR03 TaxID=1566263 RepID=UPI0008BCA45B|nr:hypothetical protein [Rhizobium sp. NFR03]SES05307.1 hypothetical protein SAMN03159406_01945 [Rhizobium sp. NFR03]